METIKLPETQPKVMKGIIPENWNPKDTDSINKFFDLVHHEATKHFKNAIHSSKNKHYI